MIANISTMSQIHTNTHTLAQKCLQDKKTTSKDSDHTHIIYEFYAFYVWWIYFPQLGALIIYLQKLNYLEYSISIPTALHYNEYTHSTALS